MRLRKVATAGIALMILTLPVGPALAHGHVVSDSDGEMSEMDKDFLTGRAGGAISGAYSGGVLGAAGGCAFGGLWSLNSERVVGDGYESEGSDVPRCQRNNHIDC